MRSPAVPRRAAILVAVTGLLLAACVPRPVGRFDAPASASPSAIGTAAVATASAVPIAATPIPSFRRPTPGPGPTFLAYTVKRGDSLTSIARAFHTTPRSIAFWSRGEHPSLDPESPDYRPDRLEVGWILLLIPNAVFDEDELMDLTPSPSASAPPSAAPSGSAAATPG
jgi:hypothetical protein